jgi:hypothetical protein
LELALEIIQTLHAALAPVLDVLDDTQGLVAAREAVVDFLSGTISAADLIDRLSDLAPAYLELAQRLEAAGAALNDVATFLKDLAAWFNSAAAEAASSNYSTWAADLFLVLAGQATNLGGVMAQYSDAFDAPTAALRADIQFGAQLAHPPAENKLAQTDAKESSKPSPSIEGLILVVALVVLVSQRRRQA